MAECFIIAEAGVNHNGSLKLAKSLVDVAVSAGADAVKFQTFSAKNLVTKSAKKVKYQADNYPIGDGQYEMLKKLELSYLDFGKLKKYCDNSGIKFISTPFDKESADFLVKELGMDIIKISSGELTNLQFLYHLAVFDKEIILSTGMSTIDEVRDAINTIQGARFKSKLTLLHCTTEYPCSMVNVNLKAMVTLRECFCFPVGYSDHTLGTEVAIAAVAMGASVVEKHFTLNRNMTGPDHKSSLEPSELATMVRLIRNVEMSFGDGVKMPTAAERETLKLVRKVIVLNRSIKAGSVLSMHDLTTKRAEDGISPREMERIVGLKLRRNKNKDDALLWEDIVEVM